MSAAASTSPTADSEEVLVEHEAMGVLRSLDVDQATTAIQALELFAAKYKTGTASEDDSKVRPPPPCTLLRPARSRPSHALALATDLPGASVGFGVRRCAAGWPSVSLMSTPSLACHIPSRHGGCSRRSRSRT